MYFELSYLNDDTQFSYIICKNPNNTEPFVREEGSSLTVKGFFKENNIYCIHSIVNSIDFLKLAKEKNLDCYVHPYLGAVTPVGLKCIDVALRSALRGNNSSGGVLSDEQIKSNKKLKCIIGPYIEDKEFVISLFEDFGLVCSIITDDRCKFSYMIELSHDNITISEFLQKIYIGSYFLSYGLNFVPLDEDRINKFVNLSNNWIYNTKFREKVITKLCKGNKLFKKIFHEGIYEKIEDEKEKVNFEEDIIGKDLYIGIQEKRHNFVINKIKELSPKLILDLGCSIGTLASDIKKLEDISNISFVGIDSEYINIRKCKKIFGNRERNINFKFINTDILFPNIDESCFKCEFLSCLEVIEHLEKEERSILISNINKLYSPKYFILTTPNYTYNKNFNRFKENGECEYRHNDHKIEFTFEQFKDEVIDKLSENYDIEIINLTDEEEQITFCIFCTRKTDQIVNDKKLDAIRNMYSPIYLPFTNYTISRSELSSGYSSRNLRLNKKNIFFIAPTISPVEYNSNFPDYLEHPSTCFEYYKERGIRSIIGENKWEILGYEFIMIDAECLPWSIKAKGLIRSYYSSGESLYLSRLYRNEPLNSCFKYLNTVDTHSNENKIKIYPFHVLAIGNINTAKGVFTDYSTAYSTPHIRQLQILKVLDGELFETAKNILIDLDDAHSVNEAIEYWKEYCNNGGEGMVFKPEEYSPHNRSDFPVQPALKVRGKEYLRMVYGIDYVENEEYFKLLTNRGVKKKRIQAIQEHELSRYIISSFLRKNKTMHTKFIASFIGMENVNFSSVDATL